ncbi:MAG: DnaB-like helicase C-terminal domain-containing protein [Caldisericaceae bacterium]
MDEIERKVIASVIKDKFLFSRAVSEGFDKDLFESNETKTIVDYILKTYGKGETIIDPELIKQGIQEEGLFTPHIGELIDEINNEQGANLENILAYIEILKRRLAEGELIAVAKKIKNYVESNVRKENVIDFTGDIVSDLRSVVIGRTKRKIQPIRSSLIRFTVELESRSKERNKILGYSLEPFSLLNETLSGARRGFYYAIAGAPRRGKTNLMLRLAASIANNDHIPVLYYSWEQTERVLFLRLLSQETLITPFDLEVETIFDNAELSERFKEGYAKIESYMNYVYLMEGRREDTINRIRSHALSVMQSAGTDKIVIFLDYLQKVPTSILYQDLAQQVDEVSGGLANLSLELNSPIFAISSLDKEGTKLDSENSPHRPTMFNCTGGGDIEYDADVAMVLTKDFHDTNVLYEKISNASKEGRVDPNRIPHFDILNLYLDKNRDAPFGGDTIIQYLFLIEDNNLIEIGYKDEAQERTYLKISKIFDWMLENGYLVNMR